MATASPAKKKAPRRKKVVKKAAKKKKVVKKKVVKKKAAGVAARTASAPPSMPEGPPGGLSLGPKRKGTAAALPLSSLRIIKGFNPRADVGDVGDLAKSIRAEGLLSSLVVRPGKTHGVYEVIAGERRYHALKKIKYTAPVLCVVREDLVGEDGRALAVAIAENSQDGRTSLTMLEIGRAMKKLSSSTGWLPAKLATETGLNVQRVRRSLKLMDAPTSVRTRVEEGTLSVDAALEVATLTPQMRKKFESEISRETTADDVKRFRKAAEKESLVTAAVEGKQATTTRGTPPRRVVTAWRPVTEKQLLLQRFCYDLCHLEAGAAGSPDYHELLGGIAHTLWDRGDVESPYAPEMTPDKKDPAYTALQKELTIFMTIVKAEANKHTPDPDAD